MELQFLDKERKQVQKKPERNWGGGRFERRKGCFKNSGLFHELTKEIKGLINFSLDTRSLSNRQWSEANGGCHKSAHVRGGPCISCNS